MRCVRLWFLRRLLGLLPLVCLNALVAKLADLGQRLFEDAWLLAESSDVEIGLVEKTTLISLVFVDRFHRLDFILL